MRPEGCTGPGKTAWILLISAFSLFLLVSAVLFSACAPIATNPDSTNLAESPSNAGTDSSFDFSLEYGVYAMSEVNSYNNTLHIAWGPADNETVGYELSNSERQQILDEFLARGINQMPADLAPEAYPSPGVSETGETLPLPMVVPWKSLRLTYTYNGQTGTVSLDNISLAEMFDPALVSDDAKNFIAFADFVINIVESSETYSNLPEHSYGFL